jgi:hypothetical protein
MLSRGSAVVTPFLFLSKSKQVVHRVPRVDAVDGVGDDSCAWHLRQRGEKVGKGLVATEEMMNPAIEERELSRALAIMMSLGYYWAEPWLLWWGGGGWWRGARKRNQVGLEISSWKLFDLELRV